MNELISAWLLQFYHAFKDMRLCEAAAVAKSVPSCCETQEEGREHASDMSHATRCASDFSSILSIVIPHLKKQLKESADSIMLLGSYKLLSSRFTSPQISGCKPRSARVGSGPLRVFLGRPTFTRTDAHAASCPNHRAMSEKEVGQTLTLGKPLILHPFPIVHLPNYIILFPFNFLQMSPSGGLPIQLQHVTRGS